MINNNVPNNTNKIIKPIDLSERVLVIYKFIDERIEELYIQRIVDFYDNTPKFCI